MPLKNREKNNKIIISSVPFYPALCHSVHLGKCSTCMIRGILKEKPTKFNISIFFFLSLLFSVGDLDHTQVFWLTVVVTHPLSYKDYIALWFTVDSSKAHYINAFLNIQ